MSEANLLKVVLEWAGLGEIGTLSWWFKGSAATHTPAQLNTAAASIITHWQSDLTPSFKTSLCARLLPSQSAQSVKVYEYAVDNLPATAIGTAAPSGWTGTASTNLFPLQVSHCVTTLTDLAGRSFRGRQYYPHQGSACTATGEMNSTEMDALAAAAGGAAGSAMTGLTSTLSISTLQWVVYSRRQRVATHISSLRIDSRLDIQRRRANSETPSLIKSYSAP